jgi:hypothetical protein
MSDPSPDNPFDRFLNRDDLRSDDDPPPAWAEWDESVICDGTRTVRPLREDEQEWLAYAAMWRESYPEIRGSTTEYVLDAARYPEVFGEGETWMKGRHLAVALVDLEADLPFGGAAFVLEPEERSAQAVLMGVLPGYRRQIRTARTLQLLFEGYDDVLERSGVDYGWCLATARHRMTQQLFHRVGWTVRGVIPGMQRSYVGLGMHRRDAVVFMDKLYNRGPAISKPPAELIPSARRIWEVQEDRTTDGGSG